MNICFEAERTEKLDSFLKNWENPTNAMTAAANATFVEFKVHRIDDVVVVKQENIYDVIAKYLVYSGTGLMLITFMIAMITESLFYTGIWFRIGFGIVFIGTLWLSPYYRYLLIWLRLKMIGYKGKMRYVKNAYVLAKLLNEREHKEHVTKRYIRTPKD